MSVPVGRRNQSRLEVLYQATVMNDEIAELAYRSFGIYSRNSILRRRFDHITNHEENRQYLEKVIESYKDDLLKASSEVESLLKQAKSIYPTTMEEYRLRVDCQNRALMMCSHIKAMLHELARRFNVDLYLFENPINIINFETKLIRNWKKSDRRRFYKKLATS